MDMNKLMRQAQEMQKKLEAAQEKIKEMVVESSVGGGMVYLKMNGKFEVLELDIKEEVINPQEKDILKDLIISAFNQAKKKAEEMSSEELQKITGGLNIPGM